MYIFVFYITVKPLFVRMRQKSLEKITAGQEYRISCETAGSKPPALLRFFLGGSEVIQVSTQVSWISFITLRMTGRKEIEYCKSHH